MEILYINHYAGSLKHGMEFRPFYMAREWIQRGHKVSILAASHSHVRATQPAISGTFTNENINNINYVWCKTPKYEGNGVKRFINILVFIIRLFQYSFTIKKRERPQVIIASSTYPLDIFPAKFMAYIFNAKLIFEVHDLWPLSPIELGGMKKTHPFIILMQLAEDFAYRYSDKVISMLPKTLGHMQSRGLDSKKFVYVPNGIDLSEWENLITFAQLPEGVKILIKKIKEDQIKNIFTIAYLGTHGLANALDNFISAAEILKDLPIHFYLVGGGPDKNKLIEFAKSKNLKNIFFENPIPKNTIPVITKLFDANYIGLQKQSLFRFGISPNKIMDYMAAGKPIINAIEAGNDPIKEANCGLSVKAEDPIALAQAIITLSQMPAEEREKLGENGRVYVYREHDYKTLAQKFLKEIELR